MTKAPVCKLCQKAHWSYEPHGKTAEVPGYIKEMAAINRPENAINAPPAINEEPPENVTGVTKTGRGRPRRYENNAEKQAAYRGRKR